MPPKLGILAGGGDLPGLIVQACREQGRDFLVVAFEGQAEKGAFDAVSHVWARLGAAGSTIEHLRERKVLPNAGDVEAARASFSEAVEIADAMILGRGNFVLNPLRRF